MPHAHAFDAIVLKTWDVGEADRFCVLFTREQGRIAARASGARRTGSRLGGALLPFRRIDVQLREHGAGWVVTGAMTKNDKENRDDRGMDVSRFIALEEGIELLLRLVTDEGALPDVFDLTLSFIGACASSIPHPSLGYAFALLHTLGFLPEDSEMQQEFTLSIPDRSYLVACRAGRIVAPDPACDLRRLETLHARLLEQQLTSSLKAASIGRAMKGGGE